MKPSLINYTKLVNEYFLRLLTAILIEDPGNRTLSGTSSSGSLRGIFNEVSISHKTSKYFLEQTR